MPTLLRPATAAPVLVAVETTAALPAVGAAPVVAMVAALVAPVPAAAVAPVPAAAVAAT